MAAAGLVALTAASPAAAAIDFTLTGTVGGLYPGFEGSLPVAVTNPLTVAIRVTIVGGDATVTDAGPGCAATLLSVASAETSIVLQPNATIEVPLAVELDSSAPDACQGATFTIALHALADAEDVAVTPTPDPQGTPGATPVTDPAALAFTGTDSITLVAIALALFAAGAFLHSRGRKVTQ